MMGPGGAQDGERGFGSTMVGGTAGAFLGSKMGLGKLGGAAAVSFLLAVIFEIIPSNC